MPPHWTELLERPVWLLYDYALQKGRAKVEAAEWAMAFVCRHGRQQYEALERMYVTKFNSLLRHLIAMVQDEWSTPGE